jgi:hypothetical protein
MNEPAYRKVSPQLPDPLTSATGSSHLSLLELPKSLTSATEKSHFSYRKVSPMYLQAYDIYTFF